MENIQQIFNNQLSAQARVRQCSSRERVAKLRRIKAYLQAPDKQQALIAALYADFKKPEAETIASELGVVFQQINHIVRNLHQWVRPERTSTPLLLVGTHSHIQYEPKGTCLVMSTWNYPFNISMVPVLYGIAAGNTVVLKPSELAPQTAAYLEDMIGELFPEDEVAVVQGDASVAQALLELPFNHIFFTGSPQVGKLVMGAAAKHLASVTLELGGKSPAVIDESVNIQKVAEATAWGKCFNAGQTCIAPDYLIVQENIADAFATAYQKALTRQYGTDVEASADLARIINDRHFARIKHLLDDALSKGAKVVAGGQSDTKSRYIAPTLLRNVQPDMAIMQEEIFGPLLPMLTFKTWEDVLAIIQKFPKPLSFYIQSKNEGFIRFLLERTSAGGTVVNDYLLGYSNPYLPFGGVNNSGIGKSMGFQGFKEFCNERGIIRRRFMPATFLYAPYGKSLFAWLNKAFQWL